MDKGDFKRWRKSLNLSQKEAAQLLGLKRRVVQYYEKGERDGKKVDIPITVRLACWAIVQGQRDYDGPPKRKEKPAEAPPEAQPQADAPAASRPKPAPRVRRPKAPAKPAQTAVSATPTPEAEG